MSEAPTVLEANRRQASTIQDREGQISVMPTVLHKNYLFVLGFYGIAAAVAIRAAAFLFSGNHPSRWAVVGLMLVFFALVASETQLTRRFRWYPYLYLALQTGLVLILSLLPTGLDFFVILYAPLSAQAMGFFSRPTGYWWIGGFTLLTAGAMIYSFDPIKGVPLLLIYGATFYWFGSYAAVTIQAEAARRESQALLAELQVSHRQLHELASQAEELAATEERNHLARELHDSVSQTIFSITLTAKAARTLLERDLELVASQLDHLQELAQEALTEMRSLIFHLRPTTVDEEGLVEALRKHVAALESHQGLTVALRVEGEKRLGRHQERRLFRIIQEALNNVSKHAQTDRAAVTLRMAGGRVWVQIEDQGRGFDPRAVGESGDHLGLVGMRERVERMGGVFTVESCPGEGTRIAVEVPEIQGDEPNGREEVA